MKLWKDNRTDQEWEIGDEELVTGFLGWSDRDRITEWRGAEYAFRLYITEPKGLNSVFEEPDFQKFMDRVWKRLPK